MATERNVDANAMYDEQPSSAGATNDCRPQGDVPHDVSAYEHASRRTTPARSVTYAEAAYSPIRTLESSRNLGAPDLFISSGDREEVGVNSDTDCLPSVMRRTPQWCHPVSDIAIIEDGAGDWNDSPFYRNPSAVRAFRDHSSTDSQLSRPASGADCLPIDRLRDLDLDLSPRNSHRARYNEQFHGDDDGSHHGRTQQQFNVETSFTSEMYYASQSHVEYMYASTSSGVTSFASASHSNQAREIYRNTHFRSGSPQDTSAASEDVGIPSYLASCSRDRLANMRERAVEHFQNLACGRSKTPRPNCTAESDRSLDCFRDDVHNVSSGSWAQYSPSAVSMSSWDTLHQQFRCDYESTAYNMRQGGMINHEHWSISEAYSGSSFAGSQSTSIVNTNFCGRGNGDYSPFDSYRSVGLAKPKRIARMNATRSNLPPADMPKTSAVNDEADASTSAQALETDYCSRSIPPEDSRTSDGFNVASSSRHMNLLYTLNNEQDMIDFGKDLIREMNNCENIYSVNQDEDVTDSDDDEALLKCINNKIYNDFRITGRLRDHPTNNIIETRHENLPLPVFPPKRLSKRRLQQKRQVKSQLLKATGLPIPQTSIGRPKEKNLCPVTDCRMKLSPNLFMAHMMSHHTQTNTGILRHQRIKLFVEPLSLTSRNVFCLGLLAYLDPKWKEANLMLHPNVQERYMQRRPIAIMVSQFDLEVIIDDEESTVPEGSEKLNPKTMYLFWLLSLRNQHLAEVDADDERALWQIRIYDMDMKDVIGRNVHLHFWNEYVDPVQLLEGFNDDYLCIDKKKLLAMTNNLTKPCLIDVKYFNQNGAENAGDDQHEAIDSAHPPSNPIM